MPTTASLDAVVLESMEVDVDGAGDAVERTKEAIVTPELLERSKDPVAVPPAELTKHALVAPDPNAVDDDFVEESRDASAPSAPEPSPPARVEVEPPAPTGSGTAAPRPSSSPPKPLSIPSPAELAARVPGNLAPPPKVPSELAPAATHRETPTASDKPSEDATTTMVDGMAPLEASDTVASEPPPKKRPSVVVRGTLRVSTIPPPGSGEFELDSGIDEISGERTVPGVDIKALEAIGRGQALPSDELDPDVGAVEASGETPDEPGIAPADTASPLTSTHVGSEPTPDAPEADGGAGAAEASSQAAPSEEVELDDLDGAASEEVDLTDSIEDEASPDHDGEEELDLDEDAAADEEELELDEDAAADEEELELDEDAAADEEELEIDEDAAADEEELEIEEVGEESVVRTPPPPPGEAEAERAVVAPPPPPVPELAASTPTATDTPEPPPPPDGAEPPPPPASEATEAAPPVAEPKKRRRPWFEVFFSDDYLRTVPPPTPKHVGRECDFMEKALGLAKGATILDVGCGLGLHAVELSRRGYLVVGLDLSLPMLSRAADEAQDHGLKINFLHGDMREMTFDGAFDAVLCWGTTFGYFDDETNRTVIRRLYDALKPKGLLLLDVVNRDRVIRDQPNLIWFEGDGCVCMEESRFNYFMSRLEVKRTVILDDGRQRENTYSIRLYSLHELGKLLHVQGFRVASVSGNLATHGVFFGGDSQRMAILAERRAEKKSEPSEGGGSDPVGVSEHPEPSEPE